MQESRNANPAPDAQWTDPNRNWTMTNDENVNTFTLYLNLNKLIAKTDMRLAYDYSSSDQAFVHSGPRIASLAATAPGQFVALPNVTNAWTHLTFDLTYALSKKLALGFSLLHEKFDVSDFATINTAGPQTLPRGDVSTVSDNARIDWWGSLLTGLRQPAVQRDDGRRADVLLLLEPADDGWQSWRPGLESAEDSGPGPFRVRRPPFRSARRGSRVNIETHSQIVLSTDRAPSSTPCPVTSPPNEPSAPPRRPFSGSGRARSRSSSSATPTSARASSSAA